MPSRKAYPTTPSLIPKAITKKSGTYDVIWDAWQHIVEEYMDRHLTVASDKLPAISGIAHKIKGATKSAYIAGLWADNIASELLWSASPKDGDTYALPQYRAPTFSWASLNVPVTYYTPDADERATFSPTVQLISSSAPLKGLNPLGTVLEASVELRGPCLSATLISAKRDDIWEYTVLIKGTSAIRISHDCALVEDDVAAESGKVEKTIRRAQARKPRLRSKRRFFA